MTTLTCNDRQQRPISSGCLVATDGRELPLRHTELRVRAGGGIARTELIQTFSNPYDEPLSVIYQLPLPADGAVSGFAFQLADERVVGEVDRRQAARERFEMAIAEGRTAALLEEDRTSLFTQEVGNIPPGEDVVAEIVVDQPLLWVDGGWEWRFPTTVAPRYLGADGRVSDAERVSTVTSAAALPTRLGLELSISDELHHGQPESPSHILMVGSERDATRVCLAEESCSRLDRDVVVRWPVATTNVTTTLRASRNDSGESVGLLTLIPPKVNHQPVSRDVTVLIDTSGSMHGEPLAQAQNIVKAVIETLGERDRLELIEFSSAARSFQRRPVSVGVRAKRSAIQWVDALRAGGATEMRSAISAALCPLRAESQRQIVLVSDGLIGFEEEIVAEVLAELPAASRVHTVGVGSAVNRSLTQAAARAGRGIEVILGVGEDPTQAAQRLVAATSVPAVVDLTVGGSAVESVAPSRLPDLFAGAPARIALRIRPEGGEIHLRGRTATGTWEHTLAAPAEGGDSRPEIRALFAREIVADLEMKIAAGGAAQPLNTEIEATGLRYQVATRLTSWVAVSERAEVDPKIPTRRELQPHEVPHGMSVESLGLRPASAAPRLLADVAPAPTLAAPKAEVARRNPARSRRAGSSESVGSGAGGLIDGIKKAFGFKEETELYEEGLIAPGCGEPAGPAEPPLQGRIRLNRDGLLILEIEGLVEWFVPDRVEVGFGDRRLAVEIVEEQSTAGGVIAAGVKVRLTLRLDASESENPSTVILMIGDRETVVELSA